jgi:outer membrane receptor for ferrienterochelin and colicins
MPLFAPPSKMTKLHTLTAFALAAASFCAQAQQTATESVAPAKPAAPATTATPATVGAPATSAVPATAPPQASPAAPAAQASTAAPAGQAASQADGAVTGQPAQRRGQRPAAPDVSAANTVTVSGARTGDMSQRQLSSAAKLVFGREELDRNGDTTLGEVMRRLPGVTSGGRPGRGGGIAMRGMGGGYTQILVNGETPPPGFNVFSLPPEQVERIEIIRGAVAEYSTQAVAGTINIVLREDIDPKSAGAASQMHQAFRLGDSVEEGRHSFNAGVTLPGRIGDFTYMLNAGVNDNRNHDASSSDTIGLAPGGAVNLAQHFENESESRNRGGNLAGRLSWRLGTDLFAIQPVYNQGRSRSSGHSSLVQTAGAVPPPYAATNFDSESENSGGRVGFTYTHRGADSVKIDLRAGYGSNSAESATHRRLLGATGNLLNLIESSSNSEGSNASVGGKYSRSVGEGHALAFGGDVEITKRDQTTVSLDNGLEEFAESGDQLQAQTRRIAAFAQDEWDLNKQWSFNLGLRWEGITTTSSRLGDYHNKSSVWSPVLHAVYRIPGMPKDQLRASVTRSYKAANLGDLIAAPSISRQNGPIYPDRYGNPTLKPELATGLEAAYEHYLPNGGILSANVFARDISNLVRRQTMFETDLNRWVNRPRNIGSARVEGLELEAKFNLREFWGAEAPMVDFRTNYSAFRSRVEGIPGPNNRIDGQPEQTANIGADYRMKDYPFSFGGGLNWTPAFDTQISETNYSHTGRKRQFDAYALWRIAQGSQLRLSANNLSADDYLSSTGVRAGLIDQRSTAFSKTYINWGLRLEMRL